MGFWSGFEGLTGHQPGAFKGFRLKDIIDDDLWRKEQRTWSGKMLPQGATEAERQRDLRFSRSGEPMMTNWYKGRGAGGGAVDASNGAQPRMGVGRDRPFPITPRQQPRMAIGRDRPFPMPIRDAGAATAVPPNRPTPPLSGNPYERSFSPGMSEIGGYRVPTMYKPYMFRQRQDQMGAEQFNPLNRRIQQSKRDQQGLPIEAQYGKGIGDAIRDLGGIAGNMEERMFGPLGHRTGALKDTAAHIWENPTSLLSNARDYWMPADKKTVIKKSAAPDVADTSTTTITEKMLGPSGHRMGALKDTAKDIWGDVSKPNFLSDPEFWRRFW